MDSDNVHAGAPVGESLASRNTWERNPPRRSGTQAPVLDGVLPEALQYGGETLAAACALLQRHSSGGKLGRLKPRKGDIAGALALIVVLRRLPRIQITLTATPGGERIRDYLGLRKRGLIQTRRLAQGVLFVPTTMRDYLRGRHRQAVRTNLHRARRTGICCRPLASSAERRRAIALWEQNCAKSSKDVEQCRYWAQRCDEPGRSWLAAYDHAGEVVGFAAVTIDAECSLLEIVRSSRDPALWALNASIVELLCASRIAYLFANSGTALKMSPNVRFLQQLLGYRVVHLSVSM
jgi:Phosphatidylglycerol lysyltransferase, C-terminal